MILCRIDCLREIVCFCFLEYGWLVQVTKGGYLEVGVQAYGDGLWHTWFDRDLTVAGKVIIREEKDVSVSYSHRLVRILEPIMRIPTLAIHLDRLSCCLKCFFTSLAAVRSQFGLKYVAVVLNLSCFM